MSSNIRAVQDAVSSWIPEVQQQTTNHQYLADVVEWLSGPDNDQRSILEVVTQDEFTHDVIINYEPNVFLAYDVT